MNALTHYWDECGTPFGEDDVMAAEPWGITCPSCMAVSGEMDHWHFAEEAPDA